MNLVVVTRFSARPLPSIQSAERLVASPENKIYLIFEKTACIKMSRLGVPDDDFFTCAGIVSWARGRTSHGELAKVGDRDGFPLRGVILRGSRSQSTSLIASLSEIPTAD